MGIYGLDNDSNRVFGQNRTFQIYLNANKLKTCVMCHAILVNIINIYKNIYNMYVHDKNMC